MSSGSHGTAPRTLHLQRKRPSSDTLGTNTLPTMPVVLQRPPSLPPNNPPSPPSDHAADLILLGVQCNLCQRGSEKYHPWLCYCISLTLLKKKSHCIFMWCSASGHAAQVCSALCHVCPGGSLSKFCKFKSDNWVTTLKPWIFPVTLSGESAASSQVSALCWRHHTLSAGVSVQRQMSPGRQSRRIAFPSPVRCCNHHLSFLRWL